MFNFFRVFPLLAFSIYPISLCAQSDYAERLAVAKEYVEISLEDMDLKKVVQQMWLPIAQQVEADTGSPLNSLQLEKLDTLYQDTFYDKMYDLLSQQDKIAADIFSLEEIIALRDFYFTSEGRSVMRKMPDIIAAQQPMITEMVKTTIPRIMPRIVEIVSE